MCLHLCVCVCVRVCVCACVWSWLWSAVCVCVCACVSAYMCMHARSYICAKCVLVCVCSVHLPAKASITYSSNSTFSQVKFGNIYNFNTGKYVPENHCI